jgi:Cu-Zn family superoxide dismutase
MNLNSVKKNGLLAILFTTAALSIHSCASVKNTSGKQAKAAISATKATIQGSGSISFAQDKNGEVKMELELSFPSKAAQTIAVHIHEHGDCGNEGNEAHGHWNPTQSAHGKWGIEPFHLGDIGNVQLDASGKGRLKLETKLWSVGTGDANDVIGKAIMVHDKADDFTTQPTGNAGARIGCGVIK